MSFNASGCKNDLPMAPASFSFGMDRTFWYDLIYHRDFRFDIPEESIEYTPNRWLRVAIPLFLFLFEPQEKPTMSGSSSFAAEIFNGQAQLCFAVLRKFSLKVSRYDLIVCFG